MAESEFEKCCRIGDTSDTGARTPLRTNGKLERLHGGMQRKIPEFGAIPMRTGDPVVRFMKWYDH